MENHKKKPQNVYKSIRLRAVIYDHGFSSIDTAPRILSISRQTLYEIERGKTTPSSNVVARMAESYHAPELLPYYCSTECPVGKARGFQATQGLRIEAAALHIISLLEETGARERELLDAAKNGGLKDHDKEHIQSVVGWLDELNHYKDELKVAMERRTPCEQ